MKPTDIIGKEVTGVSVSNSDKSGTQVDSITIIFSDKTEISFSNEYIEGFGWTHIDITYS